MLILAFVLAGFSANIQGCIIQEKSMKIGGVFSLFAGIFVMCCVFANVPLAVEWVIPLFVLCFVVTMIIPGHILNAKAKKQC
jgi:hypothetical protein